MRVGITITNVPTFGQGSQVSQLRGRLIFVIDNDGELTSWESGHGGGYTQIGLIGSGPTQLGIPVTRTGFNIECFEGTSVRTDRQHGTHLTGHLVIKLLDFSGSVLIHGPLRVPVSGEGYLYRSPIVGFQGPINWEVDRLRP